MLHVTPARPRARDTTPHSSSQLALNLPLELAGHGFCLPCYAQGSTTLAVDPVAGSICAFHSAGHVAEVTAARDTYVAAVPLAADPSSSVTGAAYTAVQGRVSGGLSPAARAGRRAGRGRARGGCVACGRGYGRLRTTGDQPRDFDGELEAGLWDCAGLVVCDQCWHLAGGAAAIAARVDAAGGAVVPVLVMDPEIDAVLVAAAEHDLLHPLDRLLVASGVRWQVLRHIAVPARMQLAGQVARSDPPARTRPATSPRCWLDEVEARIRAQTGVTFRYNSKRRRWWRVANCLAAAAARERRPLTWIAQEEIAAVVGCSDRTVRRVVAWLRVEGLLWEVVPGCRLPQQHVPDDETPEEATDRRARMAAAMAAEQAAIARAHAELDAVRAGHHGPAAAALAAHTAPGPDATGPDTTQPDTGTAVEEELLEAALVNLAPVYELRLPDPEPPTPIGTPLSSANTTVGGDRDTFVHPPQVFYKRDQESSYVQPVDNKRRAPRGSDKQDSSENRCSASPPLVVGAQSTDKRPLAGTERDPVPTRQSEAVRAAQWLLQSRLDPALCGEVSVRWLAAQIRGSRLLSTHGWTWEDLLDLLHGTPEYAHLPRWVRSPRAWIRTRIARASPALPPTRLRLVLELEAGSDLMVRRRQAERDEARRAEIAACRAAIAACDCCNDQGWLDLGPDGPQVRCGHTPETGGW